jgi:hypothetical protein
MVNPTELIFMGNFSKSFDYILILMLVNETIRIAKIERVRSIDEIVHLHKAIKPSHIIPDSNLLWNVF